MRTRWGCGALQSALRGATALAAILAAGLIGPAAAAASVSPAVESPASPMTEFAAQASPTDWDLAAAKAAVLSGPISSLPGSPAKLDEAAVAEALDGTDMRVLTVPFQPVDRDAAKEIGRKRIDLEDWARDEHEIELIVVEGYQVHFGIYTLSPNSLSEAERIFAYGDVTADVLYAIDYLKLGEKPPEDDSVPQTLRTGADPAQLDEIAAAIEADGIYVAPGIDVGTGNTAWSAGDGLAIHAAFLPGVDEGAPLRDLVTPLQQRFPDDVIVVVQGRLIEATGPADVQDQVRGSVLWTYGTYAGPLLAWDLAMPRVVSVFAERMTLLRTGAVTDQAPPAAPADVVGGARAALPWVFGAIAVLIAAAVVARPLLGSRGLARQQAITAGLAETETRRQLSLDLVELSGQLLGIEPLAVEGPARREVDLAAERFRVARETLGRDGSVAVIQEAIAEARAALHAAADHLGVPLAGGERDGRRG